MTKPTPSPEKPPSTATSHDAAYNRDEALKPGGKARMAQEPTGAEGSSRSSKTATDPVSGEPTSGDAPNQAQADQTDGATEKASK